MNVPQALKGIGVEHTTLDGVELNESVDWVAYLEVALLHDAGIQTAPSGGLEALNLGA
jgi:hypothetical protein